MKTFLALIAICLTPQVLGAADNENTKSLKAELKNWCKHHVALFNTADYDKLKTTYHFPCAILLDNEMKIVTADGQPLVDYDEVKASGWAYSKLGKVKVLSASADRAMISFTFTRMNDKDEELLTATSFIGLTKVDGKWGLKTLFLAEDIPLN